MRNIYENPEPRERHEDAMFKDRYNQSLGNYKTEVRRLTDQEFQDLIKTDKARNSNPFNPVNSRLPEIVIAPQQLANLANLQHGTNDSSEELIPLSSSDDQE